MANFRPTVAVYADGAFSTRNREPWMNTEPLVFFPGQQDKPGLAVGSYPEGYGFVVECRFSATSVYSTVWCPRVGDVNSFLLGPAIPFMNLLLQKEHNAELLEKIEAIRWSVHSLSVQGARG